MQSKKRRTIHSFLGKKEKCASANTNIQAEFEFKSQLSFQRHKKNEIQNPKALGYRSVERIWQIYKERAQQRTDMISRMAKPKAMVYQVGNRAIYLSWLTTNVTEANKQAMRQASTNRKHIVLRISQTRALTSDQNALETQQQATTRQGKRYRVATDRMQQQRHMGKE